jgi:hypothetical protein
MARAASTAAPVLYHSLSSDLQREPSSLYEALGKYTPPVTHDTQGSVSI